ncbi:MAG: MBL fold metallo-hydrolase [Alphaproteobacteria bacterium]|nr:MBL fold metallo-hydrolase [Alphaproteobacteria bacterium]
MTSPIFDRTFNPHYGEAVTLSPLIRRVVAPNASAFTFYGTGTYILGKGQNVAVIDPGPLRDDHYQALTLALTGDTVSAILITHTHMDHSPLAARLKADTGAASYGFGPHGGNDAVQVEEGADRDFTPDIILKDGDLVSGDAWTVEAVHTPGHTSNHLCFALREENVLFSGDHVMGWSTCVISPPDGDMAAYMTSLRKLLERPEDVYYPTHGNPITNAKQHVEGFIAHRQDREAQILTCLKSGLQTIGDMVPAMYRDVPEKLHPAAARSVLAHLLHMMAQDVVACSDANPTLRSRFFLPASSS